MKYKDVMKLTSDEVREAIARAWLVICGGPNEKRSA